MSHIAVGLIAILMLIAANAFFTMSTVAILAARRSRLYERAEQGSTTAYIAYKLSQKPSRFLLAVQIGVSFTGILAGALEGLVIAENSSVSIGQLPQVVTYSAAIALGAGVLLITYLSLVLGEFLPKEIALRNPEAIACAVAPAMQRISLITFPLVHVLACSTDRLIRLCRVRPAEAIITEDESKDLTEQGSQPGIIAEAEQDILKDRTKSCPATELMTPRIQIVYINLAETGDDILDTVKRHAFSRFPVCEGSLDRVVGVIHVRDLLITATGTAGVDVRTILSEPLFVPGTVDAWRLMELFRTSGIEVAFVADEDGAVEGLITMADLMRSITEDFAQAESLTPPIARRGGSAHAYSRN